MLKYDDEEKKEELYDGLLFAFKELEEQITLREKNANARQPTNELEDGIKKSLENLLQNLHQKKIELESKYFYNAPERGNFKMLGELIKKLENSLTQFKSSNNLSDLHEVIKDFREENNDRLNLINFYKKDDNSRAKVTQYPCIVYYQENKELVLYKNKDDALGTKLAQNDLTTSPEYQSLINVFLAQSGFAKQNYLKNTTQSKQGHLYNNEDNKEIFNNFKNCGLDLGLRASPKEDKQALLSDSKPNTFEACDLGDLQKKFDQVKEIVNMAGKRMGMFSEGVSKLKEMIAKVNINEKGELIQFFKEVKDYAVSKFDYSNDDSKKTNKRRGVAVQGLYVVLADLNPSMDVKDRHTTYMNNAANQKRTREDAYLIKKEEINVKDDIKNNFSPK